MGVSWASSPWKIAGFYRSLPRRPANWQAHPAFQRLGTFNPSGTVATPGLPPAELRGAYGLDTYAGGVLANGITFSNKGQPVAGDGSGETIAIVNVYDDPMALGDVNTFSSTFNLPQFNTVKGPTFTKLNETGGTSLPGPDAIGGWGVEESLDIQWAHAMAPMANIILFEASDAGNGLYTAVQTAAATPGVVVVSMSWSGDEYSTETGDDSIFTTPSGHPGVTFLAATGDSGAYDPGGRTIAPQYPAASPNVIAVGGTSLTVAVGGSNPNYTSYGSETAWGSGSTSGTSSDGGGGGGISIYECQPSYQSGVVSAYSTTKRTYPDVRDSRRRS